MTQWKKFMRNCHQIKGYIIWFYLILIYREISLFGEHLLFLLKNVPSCFDFNILDNSLDSREKSISTV